jgi:hypothetical protein
VGSAAAAILIVLLGASEGRAQSDEIQVYDGGLTPPRGFNLTLHNNFTPNGVRTPAFSGAVVPDKSWNGVAEWAYGITDWFEGGLYLPLYSLAKTGARRAALFDGFKLRLLFAVPHADDRTFFYGANVEFSCNARHWDPTRFTSEVRPIVGWHLRPVDVIVNPIVDTAYDGLKNLDFVPGFRLAYNVTPTWTVAAEEYADFGPLHQLYRRSAQAHQVYGVVNHNAKSLSIEAGIGFGLTNASDRVTLKVMVSRDLH